MKCIELYSPFKMYNETFWPQTYENLPILDYVKLYYMGKNVFWKNKKKIQNKSKILKRNKIIERRSTKSIVVVLK